MSWQSVRAIALGWLFLLGTAGLALAQDLIRTFTSIEGRATVDYVLPVDPTMSLAVGVFTSAEPAVAWELDVILIDEKGVPVQPRPGVDYGKVAFPIGVSTGYTVQNPIPGYWLLRLQSTTDSPMDYWLDVTVENSPLTLTSDMAPAVLRPDAPVVIRGVVQRSGRPVTSATASASVTLPSGGTMAVSLTDDGVGEDAAANDGIYTGVFSATAEEGNYAVELSAWGEYAPGRPFLRHVADRFHVPPALGEILDGITDFARRSTSGVFDAIVIDVPVRVTAPGQYTLDALLQDAVGHQVGATAHAELTAGDNHFEVSFSWVGPYGLSSNGPTPVPPVHGAISCGIPRRCV